MKSLIQHIAESKALHQNVNITEKLVVNKGYRVEGPTPETKSKAKKLADKYPRPKGMWANGSRLNSITNDAAAIFGDEKIEIIVPYSSFHCIGPAKTKHHDVNGLMPYSKNSIHANDATTLFYADKKINGGNYLPFQSSSDCYYIKEYDFNGDMAVFKLEKYYESYF